MSHDRFRPAWWLPGAHAQTLGARLLRRRGGVTLVRERLELPDGDFLDLDWTADREGAGRPTAPDGRPLVVVLHGLEGCARSGYAVQTYRALEGRTLAAVGLNFRSCGGEPNRLPRLYHSGETGDLRFVLAYLRERFPRRPLGAIGFSLGGNVLLKYLGEEGQAGRAASRIAAAAAISVPFDLAAGADWIERGFSRVYRRFLVRRLKRKVRAKAAILDGQVDLRQLLSARTFRDFDNAGTAPLHGFADADDYYRRSSSARYLRHIRTPTLLVHAEDDPFLPADAVPRDAIRTNPSLETHIGATGGHVGFVTGPPWAPVFWAEREAVRYLARHFRSAAAAGGEPQGGS